MLRKLFSTLLGTSDTKVSRPEVGSHSAQTQGTAYPSSWGMLGTLASHLRQYAHPDYPFLHKDYSPSSRVPCADFTAFIIDRLRHNDLASVQALISQIISANPGLGVGTEWAGEVVAEIARADYRRYLESDNPTTELEIKALFVVAAKDGGGREFWLTEEKPLLFSYALCCNGIRWLPAIEHLREKANKFIREMRKDTPYWREYPLFSENCWHLAPLDHDAIDSSFRNLSLGARIHLLGLLNLRENGRASLLQSTTYPMRNLGVNALQTADQLLRSGLCEPLYDVQALAGVWGRDQLVEILKQNQVDHRKSWNKSRLLEALAKSVPDFVREAAERNKMASLKAEYLLRLKARLSYAQSLAKPIGLLFFA